MNFSKRHKIVPENPIQIDSVEGPLRNRLFNLYVKMVWLTVPDMLQEFFDFIGLRINEIIQYDGQTYDEYRGEFICWLEKVEWNILYDFIEFLYQSNVYSNTLCRDFVETVNKILKEENSGFRLYDGKLIKITNETELEAISQAMESPYNAINAHMQNALALYSDRKNHNYSKSIQESISAVESMCRLISPETNTLGKALDKLEQKGIKIHGAQKEAFKSLYGYTSDESGIRHGGLDVPDIKAEDAKFMLVACSGFVNYLIEKYAQIEQDK